MTKTGTETLSIAPKRPSKKSAKEGREASPSQLIDAKMKLAGFGEARRSTTFEASSSRPIPKRSRSGSGEGFRCGRMAKSLHRRDLQDCREDDLRQRRRAR